jgi:WD40 repeat protein
MADIFISYARDDDEPFVTGLYRDLTGAGFDVWWDREAMESRGRTFLQEIRDAIAAVDRLILVVGPKAVQSNYVRYEWEFALATCKVVIPILRLGDYDLLPPVFPKVHCIDFRKSRPYADALGELVERNLKVPLPDLAPLHGVNALPAHFLPRPDAIDRLKRRLLADTIQPAVITSAPRQTISLQGMGGIGKSVLAAAFARSCESRRHFDDGIFWIRVGQTPSELTRDMRSVGQDLGDDQLGYYVDVQSSQVRLARLLADRVCLLILDDVWEVGHAQPFVNAIGPRCRLLITTRDGALVTALGAQGISLDVLSDKQALGLLAEWAGQDMQALPPQAREVAEECGNLPLALAIIGALGRGGPDRWENALHKLRQADLEHIELQFPNYEHPNLLRAIQVSLEALSAPEIQRRYPEIEARYLDFAVFPEDTPIPEAVLSVFWAPRGQDQFQAQDMLDFLVSRSLLGRDEDGRITLHDLQFDYVRKQVDDLPGRHAALLDAYAARCPHGWPSGPRDGYFFEHLAYHLDKAKREAELRDLFLDFEWLQARLAATDVTGVLKDFDYLPQDSELRLVHDAVKRSAQILRGDPTQFAGQLTGRLMSAEGPWTRPLLEGAGRWREAPWLRPLTASLAPPGDPLLFTLSGHEGTVRSMALSPDGRWGVTAGNSNPDRGVRLWDLLLGVELHTSPDQADEGGYNPVGITPDGRQVLVARDSDIHVWSVATGETESTLRGHEGRVTSLAVADDGRRAISAADDGSLFAWDLVNWRWEAGLPLQSEPVQELAITPDGRFAATLSSGFIKHWELESREETAALRWETGSSSWFERLPLALSPDGGRVYFGSPPRVWHIKGQAARPLFEGRDPGRALAITPDGRTAIATSDNQALEVWDVETGTRRALLPGQGSDLATLALTPDGLTVVAAQYDHYLKVWALEYTAPSIVSPGGCGSVDVTPDGRRAVGSQKGELVDVWDLETGDPLPSSATRDATEQEIRSRWAERAAQYEAANNIIKRQAEDESAGRPSAAGLLARLHSRLTRRSSPQPILVIPQAPEPVVAATNGVRAISYLPERAKTSEAEESGGPVDRYALRLWDLSQPDREPPVLSGHSSPVNVVAMTPDGRRAVSGCIGRTLRAWDLETGGEIGVLRGHRGIVWDVEITNDGRYAVSASEDRTVRVWDLHRWACVAVFTGDLPMRRCAASDDGRRIAACDVLGRIHLLRLEGPLEDL